MQSSVLSSSEAIKSASSRRVGKALRSSLMITVRRSLEEKKDSTKAEISSWSSQSNSKSCTSARRLSSSISALATKSRSWSGSVSMGEMCVVGV